MSTLTPGRSRSSSSAQNAGSATVTGRSRVRQARGEREQDGGPHGESLPLSPQDLQLGGRAQSRRRVHRLLSGGASPGDDVVHRVGSPAGRRRCRRPRAGRRGDPRWPAAWPGTRRAPAGRRIPAVLPIRAGPGTAGAAPARRAGSPARRSISRPSASLRWTPSRTSPPSLAASRTRSERAVICHRLSSSWMAWSRRTAAVRACAFPGACSSPAAVGGVGSTEGSRSSTHPYAPSRRGTSRAISRRSRRVPTAVTHGSIRWLDASMTAVTAG